ncbi:hypothetical protein HJG60_011090 [Phyllostomus discolor]|uniref:Uncharacterized protein n=1 Tax=Phyllostomus discolor TaxID=89673 RepID=A0A834A6W3_9CHIR|nr:hypothetical protein HJG60_011090 [Phyllostomus discolor]
MTQRLAGKGAGMSDCSLRCCTPPRLPREKTRSRPSGNLWFPGKCAAERQGVTPGFPGESMRPSFWEAVRRVNHPQGETPARVSGTSDNSAKSHSLHLNRLRLFANHVLSPPPPDPPMLPRKLWGPWLLCVASPKTPLDSGDGRLSPTSLQVLARARTTSAGSSRHRHSRGRPLPCGSPGGLLWLPQGAPASPFVCEGHTEEWRKTNVGR